MVSNGQGHIDLTLEACLINNLKTMSVPCCHQAQQGNRA